MGYIKFLRYSSADDFDFGANKELKPAVPLSGAKGLPSLVRGKTIEEDFEWLGDSEQRVYLLRLGLTDGSAILINQGSDGCPQLIYIPAKKRK